MNYKGKYKRVLIPWLEKGTSIKFLKEIFDSLPNDTNIVDVIPMKEIRAVTVWIESEKFPEVKFDPIMPICGQIKKDDTGKYVMLVDGKKLNE